MDGDTSSKFIASLVKSIQALCNGYIDFSSNIEVIGHIHLRIDHNKKFNYILSEEVNKSQDEAATVFSSHSYHSQPPQSQTAGSGKATPASDSPGRSRRKTQQVPRVDESDALALPSLPADVPSATKDSKYSEKLQSPSCQRRDSGDSSRSGSFGTSDIDGVRKQENSSSACKQSASTNDSLNRRRRIHPEVLSTRSQDPAAKRSRMGGSGSSATGSSGFEVIEIKEEPDESNDFFADSNAAGQEISQPDFSNLVADSLDRVGQLEGASLLAGGDAQQIQLQQLGPPDQPFPVMLHANQTASTSSASSLPGPSDQPASSSGDTTASSQNWPRPTVGIPRTSSSRPLVQPLPPKFNPEDLPDSIQGEDRARLTESHYYVRIPPTKCKKYPSKRCKVCLARSGYTPGPVRKHPKETTYCCAQCPSHPPLCSYPCFWLYHNKIKYDEPLDEEELQQIAPMLHNVPAYPEAAMGQSTSGFGGYEISGGYGDYAGGQGAGMTPVFGSPGSEGYGHSGGGQESDVSVKFYSVPRYGETAYPERH